MTNLVLVSEVVTLFFKTFEFFKSMCALIPFSVNALLDKKFIDQNQSYMANLRNRSPFTEVAT